MEIRMEWALGFSPHSRQIDVINKHGEHRLVDINELGHQGIPKSRIERRIIYKGDFSSWRAVGPEIYFKTFDICLADGTNRHQVFMFTGENGVPVYVPALVLMRALFRPTRLMLPAAFTPVGADLLSYVDYSENPPKVVLDYHALIAIRGGDWQNRFIEWLQLSKSARASAHSVFKNAQAGWLKMSLPAGQARMAFYGDMNEDGFFATKATLMSMSIPKQDDITDTGNKFIFNANVGIHHASAASNQYLPMHADGSIELTDVEWMVIEPIVGTKRKEPTRILLDAILYKLISGTPWRDVERGVSYQGLLNALQSWERSGKWDQILAHLKTSRSRA
jgi:hypothetical protein